jgi:hypothetical protein
VFDANPENDNVLPEETVMLLLDETNLEEAPNGLDFTFAADM